MMKRYVKAIGIVILIPFAIVILSAIALYIPFVQQAVSVQCVSLFLFPYDFMM